MTTGSSERDRLAGSPILAMGSVAGSEACSNRHGRGGFSLASRDDEVLFAVTDGYELLAVATAWLSVEHYVEVKLIGGRDHRRWLKELDEG
jgi:hypothetical protein